MPRWKFKAQFRIYKRPRIKAEMAQPKRQYLHLCLAAAIQRQGMQQMRRRSKSHARQQREIVASLQQLKMLMNRLRSFLRQRQRVIRMNAASELMTVFLLSFEKLIQQRQILRFDR